MFNVGWMTASAALWRRGDDPRRTIRFPVPAFLIEAGDERILVDTGLHPRAAADARSHYGERSEIFENFALELDRDVSEQLDVRTVTKVVLTHLHFDHAGGLALLPPSIPVIVQRREWTAGHDPDAVTSNGYLPSDYAGSRELVLVDGDHDLLGDGSIELLLTPGHTPGHQSVRVGRGLVLGADVAYFASGLDDHRFPAYGDDYAEQARSAERLRALRDAGARVLPGHDPDVLRAGPVEPAPSPIG